VPPAHRRHGGWRWTGAVVLLVLAALLVTISVVARYARSEILNTDTYVATVTPLASDPAVQNAIATRVSEEVTKQIDVPKLIDELAASTGRPNADAIATAISGPVSGFIQSTINKATLKFVQSAQFQKLWVNVNTQAHSQLAGVLTGKGTDVVKTQGNQIIIEVGPIVTQVKQNLIDNGFNAANAIPTVSVQVPVADVHILAGALQDAVRGDRVPAGQGEPERPADPQPDLGEPAVDRWTAVGHYAADRRPAAS
jgi:hypothetical protein